MNQEQQNIVIIHLLISIQSQLQGYRGVLISALADNMNLNQEQRKVFVEKLEEKIKDIQKTTQAQIAENYMNKFGSIDDLLNDIKF